MVVEEKKRPVHLFSHLLMDIRKKYIKKYIK